MNVPPPLHYTISIIHISSIDSIVLLVQEACAVLVYRYCTDSITGDRGGFSAMVALHDNCFVCFPSRGIKTCRLQSVVLFTPSCGPDGSTGTTVATVHTLR